jgi:hypothetical protein
MVSLARRSVDRSTGTGTAAAMDVVASPPYDSSNLYDSN